MAGTSCTTAAQQSVDPTLGSLRHFQVFFWFRVFCFRAESTPAPADIVHANGWALMLKTKKQRRFKDDCMNVMNTQNNFIKNLIIVGLFGLFCVAVMFSLIGAFIYFDLIYVFPAMLAIISFFASVILAVRHKRINIYPIAMLVIGLLFLASSIIEFGFNAFTQNMSTHDKIDFFGTIHSADISHGLAMIGVGLAFIWLSFFGVIKIKNLPQENIQVQLYKMLSILQIGIGLFTFFFGIYVFIDGLQSLQ